MTSIATASAALASIIMFATSAFAQSPGTWSKPGMTDSRPQMMYSTLGGSTAFSVTCDISGNIKFYVSGMPAQQQWPQSPLVIRLGSVERSKRPNLLWLEGRDGYPDRTGFEAEFRITDSLLQAINAGDPISAHLGNMTQSFSVTPEALRKEFADKCAALVPPGMRRD